MLHRSSILPAVTFALAATTLFAQINRIDTVTPMAPELASYGTRAIGVRTILLTDKNRPDILNTKPGEETARYDRTLRVEIWYPAALPASMAQSGEYPGVITRDPRVVVTLHGRAVRDAAPEKSSERFPLVIISHGYPGDRYLLSHMAENLVSKGYVVASIEHKDSTYDDQKAFASTLYNRPFDQLFVLNEMDRLGRSGSGSFLDGLVDAAHTGIVGYSMGGYGAVNVIGGGFSDAVMSQSVAPPNGLLKERAASNPAYQTSMDPRIKAAIAIAPWGMTVGVWDAAGLSGIKTPVLFVAGSADDTSGYEKGTRLIYESAINADRYLLTFIGANHNAGAPIPAPQETYVAQEGQPAGFGHYADAVWDTARMNNILDHFATAFLGLHLKAEADKQAYLDVVPSGQDAIYAVDREGKEMPAHTYWKGFKRRTAVGLRFEHLKASK